MRLLITGVTGQIGSRLAEKAAETHQVTAAVRAPGAFTGPHPTVRMDLADTDTIKEAMETVKPEAVIHCAALTSPDACEKDANLCRTVNVQGTAALSAACSEAGARMVYISTDLVFDGRKGFYAEEDTPNPLSLYGRSKLEGEEAVSYLAEDSCIIRTSIVYGYGLYGSTNGFFSWAVDNLEQGNELKLFTDQYRSHLYLDDACGAILTATEKGLDGLYHLASGSRESRYEFGAALARTLGFDTALIKPTTMGELKLDAKRPKDCSLDNGKFIRDTGFTFTPLQEGLAKLKEGLGR